MVYPIRITSRISLIPLSFIGIRCTELILDHGKITYAPASESPYHYHGTVASFTCNEDFELVGSSTRTCTGDGNTIQGYWTGVLTYCELSADSFM